MLPGLRLLLRALLLPLLAAALLLAAQAAPAAQAPAIHTLHSADAAVQVDGQPPRLPRPVELPFRWQAQSARDGGRATLTLRLPARPAADAERPYGLLFEALGNQAAVYINDELVAQWGELDDPDTDAARGPRLVRLPPELAGGVGDTLLLRVELSCQPQRGGGMSAVRWGPLDDIEPLYDHERLWRNGAALVYAAGMLLMAGLAAGLWWHQRDPLYRAFALAALTGVVRNLDQSGLPMPPGWPLWDALTVMTCAAHLVAMAYSAVLAIRPPSARLRCAVLVGGVPAALLAGLGLALNQPLLNIVAKGLLALTVLACLAEVVRQAVYRRAFGAWTLLAAAAATLAAGLHDLLHAHLGVADVASVPLLPHAIFGLMLVLATLVMARYSRSVHAYRDLARSLDHRVAERERQLTEALDSLHAQRQQQAVLLERQRIMQEIHDGVGSQLVGLLNMVSRPGADPEVVAAQVKLALDEMRVAVDSLQPLEGDLTVVLATLRYRLQPRLEAAGLALEWEVDSLPPRADVTPQSAMQIQRILLEGFTNVLRHAQARRIRLSAHWDVGPPERVQIVLADDGAGFAPGTARGGHGLANMRSRAASIGATLAVEAAPGQGTRVRLDWPVRREPAPD